MDEPVFLPVRMDVRGVSRLMQQQQQQQSSTPEMQHDCFSHQRCALQSSLFRHAARQHAGKCEVVEAWAAGQRGEVSDRVER